VRASRLPAYSAGGSSSVSPARTQSADRRPVVTTVTTVVRHGGQSTDTPPSTSSDHSTSSTVDSDVTPADTPPATTDPRTSTKQATARKTSHLRPPRTIVARHRPEHISHGADTVPNGRADVGFDSRPQSADSRVELSTSLARQAGSTSYVTSRQTRSRSRDGGSQASRIVAPRTCVQRQPRDPACADGTQVHGTLN